MIDQSINQKNLTQYVQGIEDIRQCWENILFTIPGTFPLLPEFGCDLFKYLDKPVTDSFGKVRNVIIAALERFEKRAKITKVTRVISESNLIINIEGIQVNTGSSIYAVIDAEASLFLNRRDLDVIPEGTLITEDGLVSITEDGEILIIE